MKIDLHVHCKERSRCGKNEEAEQVEAAIRAGLDALVFTDHSTLAPQATLLRLNAEYAPFRIFGGIELNIEGEDWVVIGLQNERLMSERWTSYPALHAFVRQHGAFLFLAHPFRYHPEIGVDLAACPPDGIELRSENTPVAAAGKIREVSARFRVPLLCNSDAHTITAFGRYYNILADDPRDDAALVTALRRGVSIVPDDPPPQASEVP